MAHGNLMRGLPHIKHADKLCDACLVRKQCHLPFPEKARYQAKKQLELVHRDLYVVRSSWQRQVVVATSYCSSTTIVGSCGRCSSHPRMRQGDRCHMIASNKGRVSPQAARVAHQPWCRVHIGHLLRALHHARRQRHLITPYSSS